MLLRDKVILVNDRDEWLNTASKEEAHRTGLLHRALSIFIVNSDGEMLLQRRALHKYHSGGLWSNTCCSHPMPGESTPTAAHRRLQEELGFDTSLTHVGAITYRAVLSNRLIEHEYDHILSGSWDGPVYAQPDEVSETRWIPLPVLDAWMQQRPEDFSAWFPLVLRFWMEHVPSLLTAS